MQLPKKNPPINLVFIKIPKNNRTSIKDKEIAKVPSWLWGHFQGWQNGNRDNGDEKTGED